MENFLLYQVPASNPLTGDITLELDLAVREWPEDWAYLIAKHSSQQLHELLLRLKGAQQGRFGFGDGSESFNAIKFSLAEHVELGQRFTLKIIRSLHGESTIWVDGQIIATGKFTPYHTPARTQALLSVGGDQFAEHKVNALFYRLQIWHGAEPFWLATDKQEREVKLRQIFPTSLSQKEAASD